MKYFHLSKSQAAGGNLAVLHRKGFSRREVSAHEITVRLEREGLGLGFQKGAPEPQATALPWAPASVPQGRRSPVLGGRPGTTGSGAPRT